MTFYIASYGRAGEVLTHKMLHKGTYRIVVPESQYKDYRAHHASRELIAIPDHMDGNVARKRNAVIELEEIGEGEPFVMCDDDIRAMVRVADGSLCDKETVHGIFDNLAVMSADIGARLFGVNPVSDKMKYRSFKPFSLVYPVYYMVGLIKSELRYDGELVRGEDVDFYFKNMLKFRKVFRDNRFYFKRADDNKGTGIGKRDGECAKYFEAVQKRWGSDLVSLADGGAGIKGVRRPLKGD